MATDEFIVCRLCRESDLRQIQFDPDLRMELWGLSPSASAFVLALALRR